MQTAVETGKTELTGMANPLYGKDFIHTNQLETREQLLWILQLTQRLDELFEKRDREVNKKLKEVLAGFFIILAFYEGSTRTDTTFYAAGIKLGADLLNILGMAQFSSAVKGENIPDTMMVFNAADADAVVIRHKDDNSSEVASAALREYDSKTRVINAGSGQAAHPTQALQDIYTIYERFQRIDNLKITFVGDMFYGRTVKSLAEVMARLGQNNEFTFIAPEGLQMPRSFVEELAQYGVKVVEADSLDQIGTPDVVYATRVQKERMPADLASRFNSSSFIITPEVMDTIPENAILMHPLPRIDEIQPAVDKDPRAVYLVDQMESGLPVRAALYMALLLEQPFAVLAELFDKVSDAQLSFDYKE